MKQMRVSVFAYQLLKQLGGTPDLTNMLNEFAGTAGTNREMDYHWANITDENLLLAKLKYPDAFKYVTIREDK